MVLLAIITSLFIAIQDPIIQKFAVRFASGYLSEKTGADIKVGRFAVTPDFRIFIDDVTVKDLKNNDLAKIDKLRTKINISDLLDGKIHLENVELHGTEANIIQYEGEEKFNFAFLVEAFKTDTVEKPDKEPMEIIVDKVKLRDVDFVFWNQNTDHPEKTEQQLMDYSHIGVSDINLDLADFFMHGDSIHASVGQLSGKELSGLDIKHFRSEVVVCPNGIYLDGMELETNNSLFDADIHMLYNGFDDFGSFVDSVVFDATIRPTDVLLSDIGVFTPVMYKMPDRLQFEGRFTGAIEHFSVDDMKAKFGKSTSIEGSLSMHPLDFENGEHTLKIKKMRFTYDDLVNFYIPSNTKTIPLPESLRLLNEGRVSLDFKGSYNNFVSDISLTSDVGDIDASIARAVGKSGDNVFSGYVKADRVKAGTLANASKYVGDLDLNADFTMKFPEKGDPELDMNGTASQVKLLGNDIDEIVLDGAMKENRFKGKVRVDDDDLFLDFNGLVDFRDAKHPKSDFEATIRDADLRALKLLREDSISKISTKLYVNLTGFDIDNLEGVLRIDSTVYRDSRGQYYMKNFNASIVNDNLMMRRINMSSDFFDFEMAGKMNFAQLVPVLNEFGNSFVDFPIWKGDREKFQKYREKHDVEQDFYFQLALKDTRTLSRLLMPSLKIAKNTTANGTFTSNSNLLNLTVRSKNIQIGDLVMNDLELKNYTLRNSLFGSLSIGEIVWDKMSETDTTSIGVDNLMLFAKMADDTIATRIRWDDNSVEDYNKALIDTYFHPHESGGIFSIKSANIVINDSLWTVAPNNYVDITDGRVTLSNLSFSNHLQSIKADGFVPMAAGDTLSVQLREFDISNFDLFFKGFDIDGFISGNAMVSSLKDNPMVLADLDIRKIAVNKDPIGDAIVSSLWNNENKSVDLKVNILDDLKKTLNVHGSYYTARKKDNLDFIVEMDSLRLNILSPFLAGVVSRMQGYGKGKVAITGSLDQPNVEGRLDIKDGGCKIGYLNTFYTFSPTIRVDNTNILLENMVLVDTLGNQAIVDGQIYHNHFKDFRLGLKLYPRDFLSMATTQKENDTFYGNVFASGLVEAKGPLNDIHLNIGARTSKGTKLTLPLNRTSSVSENDFIVFVQKPSENEEEMEEEQHEEKKKTNLSISLDVDVNNESAVKIYLPGDIGTIDATGDGNIKLGTSSSESLTLFGNYVIKNGRFQLNFKNLISRTFNLKQGGTISWSGSPTEGRIDATGSYTVKASLATLGAQVDSTTSSSSNVNVECLIHLKNALLNPTITFGMNLPNASEDVTQTVFSLIDTTNQAVMTTQALSLLLLGSFSYAGNSSDGGSTSLFDALTSNLMGLNLDLGNDWGLGVSYHSSAANAYDELQVALKTELFENRLIIETNFGVISDYSTNSSNASNLIGEFDIHYKLSKDGRLMATFYNHSNYNSNFSSFSFDRLAPYTQGLGISYSKSFNTFHDLFKPKKTIVPQRPLINKQKKP